MFAVSQSSSRGFTLIEVLVSITLLTLIGVYFVSSQINTVREKVNESVAQDVLALSNAAMVYFSQTDEWPDQANSCAGLVNRLANSNAFAPVSNASGTNVYDGPNGVTLATSCSSSNNIGSTLRITITYPQGNGEDADMLRSYLPTSVRLAGNNPPQVRQYVAAPRRAADRYKFHKEFLGTASQVRIPKLPCSGNGNGNGNGNNGPQSAYIVIPQAVCMLGAVHGLGGYYFKDITPNNSSDWVLQLQVAEGGSTGTIGGFHDLGDAPRCNGERISIGAITYCE